MSFKRLPRAFSPASGMRTKQRPGKRTRCFQSPLFCARTLGYLIHQIRMLDDRPLEEIAPLAGLTVADWRAVEAGSAPDSWEQVRLMGDAINCHPVHMLELDRLYDGAKRDAVVTVLG